MIILMYLCLLYVLIIYDDFYDIVINLFSHTNKTSGNIKLLNKLHFIIKIHYWYEWMAISAITDRIKYESIGILLKL